MLDIDGDTFQTQTSSLESFWKVSSDDGMTGNCSEHNGWTEPPKFLFPKKKNVKKLMKSLRKI
jgi:hypothetical protein